MPTKVGGKAVNLETRSDKNRDTILDNLFWSFKKRRRKRGTKE